MRFGDVPSAEAEGLILAHSLNVGDGRIRKGTVLGQRDIERLEDAKIDTIAAVRLDDGDVGENEAAQSLSIALAGHNIKATPASTGRSNLISICRGLLTIDEDRVNAFNAVHESLTLSTIRPFSFLEEGELAATIKIIPFAVRRDILDRAAQHSGKSAPICLHPFRPATIGLIQTEIAKAKPKIANKTVQVTRARVEGLGSELRREIRCRHDSRTIAETLSFLIDDGCDPIIIIGASAVADRSDVVPMGIIHAGGNIVHFGMPVDPGNILLLGQIGKVHVIVAPGSARSPILHGFDWVLQRILAGIDVGPDEFSRMGVGGLLKEISTRPQLRISAGRTNNEGQRKVCSIILAAGRSTRMGEINKMTLEIGGKAMVVRAVEAALGSRSDESLVVTGHDGEAISELISGYDLPAIVNPNFSNGLSTSVKVGVGQISDVCDGAIFLLGDMPGIESNHIDRLIDAFERSEHKAICVSTHDGKRGNPILWPRRYFAELLALKGDIGGRNLIGRYQDAVIEVEQGPVASLDIDTPEAFEALVNNPAWQKQT
jgi:molybdenum cofactor cytidylyltransferase